MHDVEDLEEFPTMHCRAHGQRIGPISLQPIFTGIIKSRSFMFVSSCEVSFTINIEIKKWEYWIRSFGSYEYCHNQDDEQTKWIRDVSCLIHWSGLTYHWFFLKSIEACIVVD